MNDEAIQACKRLAGVRVVLVEPSHPGNIGGAARAMKTMGLADLVLVNPGRFPDPQAEWRAAGAQDVLDAARVCDSLTAAIGDCQWVVGTGMLNRRIPWPIRDPESAATEILALPPATRAAIVFGREASGLTNDELQQCNVHLQIPANPDYGSLNLAMAVQVVAYALWHQAIGAPGPDPMTAGQHAAVLAAAAEPQAGIPAGWDRPLAPRAHVEGMLEHLQAVLESSDFLAAGNPGQTLTRLRRLFLRLALDETEVQMLRGILTSLDPRRKEDTAARNDG